MKKPKIILFDYGQTLVNETKFDGIKGTREILKYATVNKYNLSAEQVQNKANEINIELGRFDPEKRHLFQIEVPNHMFQAYLYTSLGIKLSLSPEEADTIFWDASSPGETTEGIEEFLDHLHEKEIRSGVISNISYAGSVVEKRINSILPNNHFEFIIATSEYMYRKPNKRIFELALEIADLNNEDVWYIGDNYECDIVGARNAGIYPIQYIGAIDTTNENRHDVQEINNWTELIAYIENCTD